MIPKIIHYCWFGRKPLPPLAVKCIESWKKYLPDYTIKEWNEDNFDINIVPYTREAYEVGKYAFVSDYARFYILYHHGGLYFDTDVEVIRPMDDLVGRGAFMGCENEAKPGATALAVAPGLGLGCNPGLGLYAEILELYSGLHFKCVDGGLNLKTVVEYTTDLLVNKGLRNISTEQYIGGIWIYPKEFFSPKSYHTGEINITSNTYCIHHFDGKWLKRGLKYSVKKNIHKALYLTIGRVKHNKVIRIIRIIKDRFI